MSRRDYRHRETKKPKRDEKKIAHSTIFAPPASVEVIKKGKKGKEEEE